MKCPVCKETDLVMAERQSVEIDYCPQCRGVWLDRGELDKIIERSIEISRSAPVDRDRDSRAHDDDWDDDDHHHQDEYYRGTQKKKRRGSFLGDLFDF